MSRFVDLLWPEDPPGWLLVWTLPDKRSHWTASKDDAHRHALSAGADRDVYIEVACGPDPSTIGRPAESARIKSDEVVALPGFFADLDCSPHPSKVHFDSKEHGLRFIGRLPLKPTVIVDSGGGLHAWWLFREPWVFDDDAERRRAERLEYGWTNYLRRLALEEGVRDGVDHVKDMARVLRYPGTVNRKYREPRRVEVVTGDGPRWNQSDFEPWESEVAGHKVSAGDLERLDLKLTAQSEPPFGKLKLLIDLDPKFRATWERRRQLTDPSTSAYDMSLATQLALNGWPADEIAPTLVAWRREHGLPLKLREQYYAHTIAKAFVARDQYEAERSVESGEVAPGGAEQLLAMIEGVTGVAVSRIVVHGEPESGRYVAVIGEEKHVKLGGLRELLRWETWQGVAFAHGIIQGRPKAQRWDIVLRAMQRIVEARPAEDADEARIFEAWIADHLHQEGRTNVTDERGREFARNILRHQAPYRSNGNVYVCLESLRTMLKMRHERVTQADLVRMFRQAGWRSVRKQARDDGQLAQCRYWESPEPDLDIAEDRE